jgi:hypothetical protein
VSLILLGKETARRYASQDLNVLPLWWAESSGRCACGGRRECRPAKHPIGVLAPRAHISATKDVSILNRWWNEYPSANLGIELARSNLVAIDIDGRTGGTESEFALTALHGDWPDTWTHATGDGSHIVFLRPPGIDLYKLTLAPGVDLMASGYIVAPPSVHSSGREYVWDVSNDPLDDAPLAQLPTWIIDKISQQIVSGNTSAENLFLNCDVPDVAMPSKQLVEMLVHDEKIRDIWKKQNPSQRRTDLTNSGWTFSLGLSLFWRQFSDQQVCDAMVAYREHIGAQPKPRSWFLRTCSRAKSSYLNYLHRNTQVANS